MPCPTCSDRLWLFQQPDGLHVFGREVADRTIAAIAKRLEVSKVQLTPFTTFVELGADSLEVVEITMQLEEEFGITFPAEEDESVQTVGDAIRAVELCLRGKNG